VGTISVREATHEDVASIRLIGEKTWPATYEFAGEEYIAHGLEAWWSEEAVIRGLETTRTLVAVRDGVVIGVGNLDLREERPIIWKLYVLPDHQGTGAGHALMEALLAQVPPEAREVLLEYTDGNHTAADFYRRHDFTERRRDRPGEAGWPDQVWMVRDLGAS
jgi:GNAT superfamily N-acetyltransferase